MNSSPQAVFLALSEGMLFSNCGADGERLEISFRVGGGYKSYFASANALCCGKFLEIVPDRKIVFTWGDEGSDAGFPNTRVSVELFPEAGGAKTKLLIVHTGFESKEDAEAHDYGWCAGLDDFSGEITEGRIRIVRVYSVSRDVLCSVCSDPQKFFAAVADTQRGDVVFRVGEQYRFPTEEGGILGEFKEIVSGRKIVFSWLSDRDRELDRPTRVTLMFEDEEDGGSTLELVHELLPIGESVKVHRKGWERLLAQLQTRFESTW